jgi:hypothetical protein
LALFQRQNNSFLQKSLLSGHHTLNNRSFQETSCNVQNILFSNNTYSNCPQDMMLPAMEFRKTVNFKPAKHALNLPNLNYSHRRSSSSQIVTTPSSSQNNHREPYPPNSSSSQIVTTPSSSQNNRREPYPPNSSKEHPPLMVQPSAVRNSTAKQNFLTFEGMPDAGGNEQFSLHK